MTDIPSQDEGIFEILAVMEKQQISIYQPPQRSIDVNERKWLLFLLEKKGMLDSLREFWKTECEEDKIDQVIYLYHNL